MLMASRRPFAWSFLSFSWIQATVYPTFPPGLPQWPWNQLIPICTHLLPPPVAQENMRVPLSHTPSINHQTLMIWWLYLLKSSQSHPLISILPDVFLVQEPWPPSWTSKWSPWTPSCSLSHPFSTLPSESSSYDRNRIVAFPCLKHIRGSLLLSGWSSDSWNRTLASAYISSFTRATPYFPTPRPPLNSTLQQQRLSLLP